MHPSALYSEVLEIFSPKPGENYIDATINGGGHALAILKNIGPKGILLGIDRDCGLVKSLQAKINSLKIKNAILVCDNFTNIRTIGRERHLVKIDGILFDLGFSLYHIEASGRGFSFLKDEPLDMRYNPADTVVTARTILNQWPEDKIEAIIREYGQERFSRRIAHEIVKTRNKGAIARTGDLTKIISRAVPGWYCWKRIHPATKTFQALRIAVNNELAFAEKAIREAIDILAPGGKIAVISFHSLEDRIVKRIFKESVRNGKAVDVTKKVIRQGLAEKKENPRSRSAKLRVIQKI